MYIFEMKGVLGEGLEGWGGGKVGGVYIYKSIKYKKENGMERETGVFHYYYYCFFLIIV